MTDDFQTFANELLTAPEEQRQDIIQYWDTSKNIVPNTPISTPAHLTYTDDGVAINVPGIYTADVDFNSENFSLEKIKAMAGAWAETYQHALATQPARDEAAELRDAVKQAGTDVPLDDTKADTLVEELNKLGYEIIKKTP